MDDLALFTVKGRYIYDESIDPGDSFQDADAYAGISRDGGRLTVTYTIGTVTVILQQGA